MNTQERREVYLAMWRLNVTASEKLEALFLAAVRQVHDSAAAEFTSEQDALWAGRCACADRAFLAAEALRKEGGLLLAVLD